MCINPISQIASYLEKSRPLKDVKMYEYVIRAFSWLKRTLTEEKGNIEFPEYEHALSIVNPKFWKNKYKKGSYKVALKLPQIQTTQTFLQI